MTLQEFNQLDKAQAENLLKQCANIPTWSRKVVLARPFESVEQLYEVASQLADDWQWSEIKQSLDKHPRIGEKKAKQALSQQEEDYSKSEQSSLNLDDEMQQRLLEANRQYENQFGFIFLIRAHNRSSEEILSEINRRLNNSLMEEQQEIKTQLKEISLLRLEKEIQHD